MGKTEIIANLARKIYGNPSLRDVQKCTQFCDTLVDIIIDALIDGKKVMWKGFLCVEIKDMAPRKRMNLSTGVIEDCSSEKKISCKLAKAVKDAIKESWK